MKRRATQSWGEDNITRPSAQFPNPLRLLVVSHSCSTSTNQSLYCELSRAYDWQIQIIVPALWKDEFENYLDQPAALGLQGRVNKVPVWFNGNIIFHLYRKRWTRFLERKKFDLIYVNHEPYALATTQVCLANQRTRRPAAFGFYSCQNISKRYPVPFRWFERYVYRNSDFAFPISEAVSRVLSSKGFSGINSIAPLPLDTQLYFPRSPTEDLDLIPRQPNECVLGFVGRLVKPKGLLTLAKALGQIQDLAWKLVVIGTGDDEQEFREALKAEQVGPRVDFLGYVPHGETPRYLSAMDLLVVPSETQPNWKEQFGRVITEAMACGTPVIGSNSGEIPRLIGDSSGGAVFPERNSTALANLLRIWIGDTAQRARAAERGKDWVTKNGSIESVAKIVDATLRQTIQTRNASPT